jgi:hypothetical protein
MFLCDKEGSVVYKIDFFGTVLTKIKLDGKPYDTSLNDQYVIVTDYKAHELIIYDERLVVQLKKKEIQQAIKYQNGPLNCVISKTANYCLVKNSESTEVYLFDKNLDYKATFKCTGLTVYTMALIEQSPSLHTLVVSCRSTNAEYKLLIYQIRI